MLLESKNSGLWQIMDLDKYFNTSRPCRTPVRFLSHTSIGNTWHDRKRLRNPEKIKTVDKVDLFWMRKTLPGYFRCVTLTITKICCDRRSLDIAHVCSLLICVDVWKCDSCEYAAASFEHTTKVRILRLQWIPRCCVNIGIGCKLHSVNTLKRRTSCGWQYTNVRTCRRVDGVLGVRSIGTHPVPEEFSEIEWAVRLGLHHLFRIRKTLLTSTCVVRLCRSLLAPHGRIKSGNRTNRQVSFIDIDAVPQVLFLGDKADYCKAIPRAAWKSIWLAHSIFFYWYCMECGKCHGSL